MTKSVPTTSAFNPLGDKGQLPDMADVLSALMVVCAAEQVAGSQALAKYVRNVSSVVCPATDPQQERRPSRKPAQSPKAS